MAHHHAPCPEAGDGRLQLLDRGDVEVVGGLVEHEHVDRCALEERQQRAGPLPQAQAPRRSMDVLGAETELRQQGAHRPRCRRPRARRGPPRAPTCRCRAAPAAGRATPSETRESSLRRRRRERELAQQSARPACVLPLPLSPSHRDPVAAAEDEAHRSQTELATLHHGAVEAGHDLRRRRTLGDRVAQLPLLRGAARRHRAGRPPGSVVAALPSCLSARARSRSRRCLSASLPARTARCTLRRPLLALPRLPDEAVARRGVLGVGLPRLVPRELSRGDVVATSHPRSARREPWCRSSSTTLVATSSRKSRSWLATSTGPACARTNSTMSRLSARVEVVGRLVEQQDVVLAEEHGHQRGPRRLPTGQGAERPVRVDPQTDACGDARASRSVRSAAPRPSQCSRPGRTRPRPRADPPPVPRRPARALGRPRRRRCAGARSRAATPRGPESPAAATPAWRRAGPAGRSPVSTGRSPTSIRISVDLPDPLGPTRAVTSPSARVRSRPETRMRAPKDTSRPVTVRVAGTRDFLRSTAGAVISTARRC